MIKVWAVAVWVFALFSPACFADGKVAPEVSVVIPVYNTEAYVARALDSVLRQSFTDLEIICVDDGSTDGSLEILKNYASKDPRIIVLENVVNRGALYTRLRGILHSRGKYIMTIDSDDEFSPKIIEKAHKIATKYDADIVHFGTKSIGIRGEERPICRKSRPMLRVIDDGQNIFDIFVGGRNFYYVWDKMFARKSIIAAAQYLFPWAEQNHITYNEDIIVSVFIIRNAKKYIGIKAIGYHHYESIGVIVK